MGRLLHVCQRQRGLHVASYVWWLLLVMFPILVHAEQFTGKVVGISDGDTLSVLREGKAVKVRLYGVDAPEKAQALGPKRASSRRISPFSTRSPWSSTRQTATGASWVRLLLPDGRSLNQELVKAGMAWWYRQYAPNDTTFAQLEVEARCRETSGCGLIPTPHRRGSGGKGTGRPRRPASASAAAVSPTTGPFIGNRTSKVYHWPGCPDYDKVSEKNRVALPARGSRAGRVPASGELSVSAYSPH